MKNYQKILLLILTLALVIAAIVFGIRQFNTTQEKNQYLEKKTVTVKEVHPDFPDDTGKAVRTNKEDTGAMTLKSTTNLNGSSLGSFSYLEYALWNSEKVSENPALFYLWDDFVGPIDEDLKNALWLALCPATAEGEIRALNEQHTYNIKGVGSPVDINKQYRFYSIYNALTNYTFTNGTSHFNVAFHYRDDGQVETIRFSNGTSYQLTITLLYKGNISNGFSIQDTNSDKVSKYTWNFTQDKNGKITSATTEDDLTYRFSYNRGKHGLLSKVTVQNKKKKTLLTDTFTYGSHKALESVHSTMYTVKNQTKELTYKLTANLQ